MAKTGPRKFSSLPTEILKLRVTSRMPMQRMRNSHTLADLIYLSDDRGNEYFYECPMNSLGADTTFFGESLRSDWEGKYWKVKCKVFQYGPNSFQIYDPRISPWPEDGR